MNSGDETLVGDKGITLSGGQKSRISLARAVYSDCDIVLLDDPLSAVDAEVANHIFHECIKTLLQGKTVILATHQIQFLSQADKILVLEGGSALFYGSYEKLQEREDIKQMLGDVAFNKGEQHVAKNKIEEKEEKNEKISIEEEEITNSDVKFSTYIRYFKYGFGSMFIILLVFCVMGISQVFLQYTIFWVRNWSNSRNQDSNYYIKGMGILILLTYVFFGFRVFFYVNLFLKSNAKLHNEALKSIALAPSVFFDKNPTGRIINRFSKDVGVVDGPLQFYLYESVSSTLIILGPIVVSIIILPYNLIVLPLWLLILYSLIRYVSPIIIKLRKIELVSRGPLLSTVNSGLNGLPVIRCLKLQRKFKKDIKKFVEYNYRAYVTFQTLMRFNQCYADLGTTLIVVLNVCIIIGTKGQIDAGLAAFSMSTTSGMLGLSSIWVKFVLELGTNMASAQRLLEYSDIDPESGYILSENFELKRGEIKFENVFMRYRPTFPYSLQGLTFSIQPGHKVGIIGRTGAGKSSILQVLFRLVNPEKGTVYLDGVDYMKIGLQNLRKQLSVIPQTPVLFTASIRDNLDPFKLSTDEELIQALEEVQLKDIILEYENGLYTEVRGDGITLSAGQKQLLCLARVVIRKNKIIMMDEATANVDNETDRIIQETIKNKFETSTLLVIAHRIRTIIQSDKIIVVDAGKCKEYGSPSELYNIEDSLFRNMIYHTGPEESQHLVNCIMLNHTKNKLD